MESFKQWQERQRELHEMERAITAARRDAGRKRGPGPTPEQLDAVERLRDEVDNLFPDAMRELEAQVQVIDARRHKLSDG